MAAPKNETLEIIGLIISFFGMVGVILSVLYGFKQQKNAINNQWGQEFYKQRMSIYLKASDAASRIAYLREDKSDSVELKERILEFQTLFGGPMVILEGSEVAQAMIYYKEGLDSGVSVNRLKSLALLLSHVLKNDSRELFLEVLPDPTAKYGDNDQLLARMRSILADHDRPGQKLSSD